MNEDESHDGYDAKVNSGSQCGRWATGKEQNGELSVFCTCLQTLTFCVLLWCAHVTYIAGVFHLLLVLNTHTHTHHPVAVAIINHNLLIVIYGVSKHYGKSKVYAHRSVWQLSLCLSLCHRGRIAALLTARPIEMKLNYFILLKQEKEQMVAEERAMNEIGCEA